MLRRFLALCLLTLAGLHAQTATDSNLGSRLTVDSSTSPATYTFSWWGTSGRYYLVMSSPDLTTWAFLPNFNPPGADAALSIQFTTTADKYFFRALQFDPNNISGLADTNANGLPDQWETYCFGSIGANPAGDPDADGLSTLTEFVLGTNPTLATTNVAVSALSMQIYTPLE